MSNMSNDMSNGEPVLDPSAARPRIARVTNTRVHRSSNPAEVRICASELEVPQADWAVVPHKGIFEEDERGEVFRNGEYIGIAASVEVVPGFVEIVWAPNPPED
jgi:hypothetical protein